MQQGRYRAFRPAGLDKNPAEYQNLHHIRPLAVSPLNYPEGVPIPWGFLISGLPKNSAFGRLQ